MNKQSDTGKKVNDALESLGGIQRAEPAPWFLTRVKARLEREKHNIWETTGSYMARPAIAFAGLLLILCINAFILFEKDTPESSAGYAVQNSEEEMILTAVSNTSYDYENIEP
ncbi:MAG: hypothetical protein WDO71_17670 [Bacteroidota bacterium]